MIIVDKTGNQLGVRESGKVTPATKPSPVGPIQGIPQTPCDHQIVAEATCGYSERGPGTDDASGAPVAAHKSAGVGSHPGLMAAHGRSSISHGDHVDLHTCKDDTSGPKSQMNAGKDSAGPLAKPDAVHQQLEACDKADKPVVARPNHSAVSNSNSRQPAIPAGVTARPAGDRRGSV
jgi:hypothetical protein